MSISKTFEHSFERAEALMRNWSLEEATRILEALEQAGGFPNRLRHDLSVVYAQQGLFAEALHQIEAALALEPKNRALWHHFLALQKNNPRQPTAEEWRAMHLAYGDTLRDSIDVLHLDVAREPGRRLRVGYLCPDTHLATERFMWPVLAHFDAASFEVFAYWCHSTVTAERAAEYPRVAHRSILGLGDDAVTSMIMGDAIDVLVDIAGHGAGNRLPVMVKRPAPMQATWLDYLATTGLDTVDFRITDCIADPEGAEAAHVERLLRMSGAQWCYRSPIAALPVALPPVTRTVFGSIAVPLKLSETVLDIWGRLLSQVPDACLRLLGVPEGRARGRIAARLALAGIDAGRFEMNPRLAQNEFIHAIAGMDVVLDTHPFSGATSTLDALWSGVPVVTLAGDRSHSRSTASILRALGREEWIARSPDEYVRIAARLAREAREPGFRERLRGDFRSSPLCDGQAFARAMEETLREGWNQVVARSQRRPREITAEFWRGLRTLDVPTVERVAVGDISNVVDLAQSNAIAHADRGEHEWLLLTHSGAFRADVASSTIPSSLLQGHDALAALGVAELASAEPIAAGQGNIRGVELDDAATTGRLYARVYVPQGAWPCVALAGGLLLARRSRLLPLLAPLRAGDSIEFRREVVRVSHQLHREGARLGVSVGLAVADRSWNIDEALRYSSLRTLEVALGLPRWGQKFPSARPMKATVTSEVWASVRPALEMLCDSRN
jgi:hypothetical protein